MTSDAIESLSSALRGDIVQPSEPTYDKARAVYNAMHDAHPKLIVHAVDTADVVAAVNFARTHELLLAVRGGGHSVPGFGTCDGGMVLDLGRMNSVHVDVQESTVLAGGGCTLGDLDHATHGYGLAVPGGTVSTTGLAGLTLGGGMGHLSRGCGLSIDNLVSVEMVTAAGDIVTSNAEAHPDLFWAIRGGGGNFGVVTSFRLRAHAVPTVFGGPTFFELDEQVMRNYQALMNEAPEQLNALFAMARALPVPFVPESRHGDPVMIVLGCWSGSEQQDEGMAASIAKLGTVIGQGMWRMPYPEMNMFFDELLPPGLRHYWKASSTTDLNDGAIAAHLKHGPRVGNLESGMFMFPINGACHRVPDEDSAFANRQSSFAAVISGSWHEAADDESFMTWVRGYFDALAPYSERGGYVNFMGEEDAGTTAVNYGAKLERLRSIKAEYDPGNLFRVNQNISPKVREDSLSV
jgi:FAD/FMN-containing dehydrogenase